jgi:hypothetical protein
MLMTHTQEQIDITASATEVEMKASTQAPELIPISPHKDPKSSAYYRLLQPRIEETAARIIQRFWRSKRRAGNSDTPTKFVETLNGPLTLRFIQQPKGFKFAEHAQKINAGQWLDLDFNDPQGIRNLFTALRCDLINADQLATAVMLFHGHEYFRADNVENFIKEYRFDDPKGPYDFTKITYADKTNIDDFRNKLITLPVADQKYFVFNFSYKLTIAFLYMSLTQVYFDTALAKRNDIIKKYIERKSVDESEKAMTLGLAEHLSHEDSCMLKYLAQYEIKDFILKHESHLAEYLQQDSATPESQNLLFFNTGVRLSEQHPSMELSPDFDPDNPDSPLICLTLLTMSAFNNLQLAMHGKDTTLPLYVAGIIPVNLMRAADERLNNSLLPSQQRPMELPHPDLTFTKQHKAIVVTFFITWHDLYHLWRNGSNTKKDLARFLRGLLNATKGYYMSRKIWSLTDIDISGQLLRNAKGSTNEKQELIKLVASTLSIAINASESPEQDLLLIVDMIKNEKQWNRLMGIQVQDLLSSFVITKELREIYGKMNTLIKADGKEFSSNRSTVYYVLRYLLQHESQAYAKQLCGRIIKSDILAWYRNGGLYIKAKYAESNKNITLQKLSPQELSTELNNALARYEKENIFEIKIENKIARQEISNLIDVLGSRDTIRKSSDNVEPVDNGHYTVNARWLQSVTKYHFFKNKVPPNKLAKTNPPQAHSIPSMNK